MSFDLKSRINSFKFAFAGLQTMLKEEHNARVHLIATIVAIILALVLDINSMKWMMLFLAIALVWMAELFNSAIENICDLVSPEHNPFVKKAKDMAAAAVLIASILSVIMAFFIFYKPILKLF